ncbi:MAG: 1-(5-phosphoribosyl)-5-[(5-phosphoribosylamino)methylideneamino]imidazole-4-carboxamide isomerase [Nitrospirae bacterium]|nr:MAG: 1-(5-phosphoribosyl)-5-[(5-phosphoribosylamino)methylideneamino]imidazole-4-carboxamide isomerase [Nitrospirae bacterium 13_2_20CM_2_62_8]OLC44471.1 MAG: 1-(5-phosphoribosyl)-5-[(5-phosphoribosylamino)methylideneamino]imidazole-4-carboxamide isomerase [Nitrospirae bacterium 13_1_40CM_4_62_6]OLD41906.1 MAG: 1-(5-phosphoribosyl)-5-[(5-phosphoribosylamino)methylideneamino]imidazole-4-carboxamide isomerase [Nitrospirae bacterium 13_1_40CM_2_62_10]OLE41532.1 MAG: 1-(5-phosphoribosyl)-5-[(5-ph
MLLIPAIDLKDGRCVRLRQGDMRRETIYSEDPVAVALQWEQLGAPLLHVVDLNGAIEGRPANLAQIEAILNAVSVPIQVGGGVRTLDTVRTYLGCGAKRVVMGTAVLQDRAVLEDACELFPERILVGIDAKNGKVAVKGWTAVSDTSARDLVKTLAGLNLAGVIYTDISRDGMLEGPDLSSLKAFVKDSPVPVIASGGITRIEDIRAIQALDPRIEGVIVGKALYDGKLDLKAALAAVAG